VIYGPRVVFYVPYQPVLETIHVVVPGAEVFGWVGREWVKKRDLAGPPEAWSVHVALHSAWRVAQEVQGALRVDRMGDVADVYTYVPEHRAWLEAHGRRLVEAAVERGRLKPAALEMAKPYQLAGVAWAATRPWSIIRWDPGTGKTLMALMVIAALTYRRVLIVCPAAARKEWRSDDLQRPARVDRRRPTTFERFSTLPTFRFLPKAEQDDDTIEAFCARNPLAVAVAGIEALHAHVPDIKRFRPELVIFDEVHKLGATDRWKVLAGADGGDIFEKSTTDGGNLKQSVVASDVSRLRSVQNRIGLTGTPLDDGRHRRLWAPIDLVSPGGVGPYSAYATRYCGRKMVDGYPDDKESTHPDELRARLASVMFHLPTEESRRHWQGQIRLEVDHFRRGALVAPEAMRNELKALAKLQGAQGCMRRREGGLALAASMKRPVILARAKEFLEAGLKVMIYLGRKKTCDLWAEQLGAFPGNVAHGDMGPKACDAAVEEYALAEGARWLIGTWDAVGESKNGMQCTNLGIVAQLPVKPSQWIQGVGRWDRMDGVGTLVWVPIAEESQDTVELARLIRKFGAIERFLLDASLRRLCDQLDGEWLQEDQEDLLAKLGAGGGDDEDR
jgi:hypothetical protein